MVFPVRLNPSVPLVGGPVQAMRIRMEREKEGRISRPASERDMGSRWIMGRKVDGNMMTKVGVAGVGKYDASEGNGMDVDETHMPG